MRRNLTMFDLGCGLGGASAAMRDRGWKVFRIDREHDVRADRYCDLRSLLTLPRGLDLIWCSSSCSQFTIQWLGFGTCVRKRKTPDLSVELHIKQLLEESAPRFWVFENVSASRPWLTPIFGPVRCFTGGHVYWTNLPLLVAPQISDKQERSAKLGYNRKRHLVRSLIPYEMSLTVAKTVERLTDRRRGLWHKKPSRSRNSMACSQWSLLGSSSGWTK